MLHEVTDHRHYLYLGNNCNVLPDSNVYGSFRPSPAQKASSQVVCNQGCWYVGIPSCADRG
jgi:hypothetical protein